MAVSALATKTVPADPSNYTKGRGGHKIEKITVHHMAGVLTSEACGRIFQPASRNGSSHYGIGYAGDIASYVDEDNMAWTDSNRLSNQTSVTIECSNSAMGGDWPVSDATFNSLVELCVDIVKRNNIGDLVVGSTLTYHSMYAATNCPGPYLKAKLGELASRVNQRVRGETPAPSPSSPIDELTDEQLADKVIRGDFGNGEDRKKALGDRYAAVQAIVNKRLLPNQEKKEEPAPTGDLTGKQVVPIKLQDVNGTPLRQYDAEYTVLEDNGDSVVLGARGAVWARIKKENVRLA